MNNLQVIINFLEGTPGKTAKRIINGAVYNYEGRTLDTDGSVLINYSTKIGYKKDDKLFLNSGKYSVTTSKIQNQLYREAQNYYKKENIIFY